MINALNSGARVFMADFEDACSPTWTNLVEGQRNLRDAVRRTISLETAEKTYRLNSETATLLVRPRGWHLPERHLLVDGEPVSASLFDFGLVAFHNAAELLERGSGPYFYLPKLESHLEARLWAQAFSLAEETLGLPPGSIRCTVLIETILAAFEMDEILYELRDYGCALNAGPLGLHLQHDQEARRRVLPDRAQVTMTVPFMRAYSELLVRSCHRRGAHAIGGMAAFIPSRRTPRSTRSRSRRCARTRSASPATASTAPGSPTPISCRWRPRCSTACSATGRTSSTASATTCTFTADQLLDFTVPGGTITDEGLRANVSVGARYLDAWLRGNRGRCDRQPDGRRGDGRDLPRPGLELGAGRVRRPGPQGGAEARGPAAAEDAVVPNVPLAAGEVAPVPGLFLSSRLLVKGGLVSLTATPSPPHAHAEA